MFSTLRKYATLPAALLIGISLSARTTMPTGPSALVLPGTGKNFDEFRADDFSCRHFAKEQIGGTSVNDAALDSGARSAALGTLLGALAGAAINGDHGAAVGAGTGLVFGGAAGVNAADRSGYVLQRQYDYAYQQCMYAKGHRIPASGRFAEMRGLSGNNSGYYPPPPPPDWTPR